ncbi:MAG: carboxypeptidase regulatory-like domain-containing protein [Limisphaerales bacterium]
MQLRKILCALAVCISFTVFADEVTTINLKPFVGRSPFDIIKADWVLPRGDHIFDGVPWKIDGVILLYGSNPVQKTKPARTNVNDIPVGRKFEVLHLLAGAQQTSSDGTVIAKVHLNYIDGTEATLDIGYANQVLNYIGPWHKADKPLKDKTVHQAWHAQFGPSANNDEYLRLFHVPLNNPHPDKDVRAISLQSAKKAAALMVAAITVGSSNQQSLPNDDLGKAPFPDLRPRSGELATGEGFVYTPDGKPISGALAKVVAARNYSSGTLTENENDAEATTDSNGHFALRNLPDDNAYRVLIAAAGFQPYVYHGIDAKSDPVRVRLENATNRIGTFAARARIVDLNGKPIPHAMVERDGVGYGTGSTSWGEQDFPEYVVADTNGEFILSRDKEFNRVQVKIRVPGLAPLHEWISVSNKTTVLEISPGATLRGRVIDIDGKPLGNVKLGISGVDRNSELFAGSYNAMADADGNFEFKHVMPRISWNLYGTIASFKKYGALPARKIISGAHDTVTELGNLQVVPALRLAGQVKTKNGESLPKKLTLRLGIAGEADGEAATVDKNGNFEFPGLYASALNIYVNRDGWKLSSINRSLSFWNPWELVGKLEKTKTDMVVMIEKGSRDYEYDNDNGNMPDTDNPSNKEISGVENLEATAIILAGSVVDEKTGKPLANCKIVPGYKPSAAAWGMANTSAPEKNVFQKLLEPLKKKQENWWEKPYWMPGRTERLTNGAFSIPFVPLQSKPMLRVEADGYEPFISEPTATSTNMTIRMSRGHGPTGTVLLPDGKPAVMARVLYAAGSEQYGLSRRKLDLYGYHTNILVTTAADGTFTLMARANGSRLYFSHQTGYAEQPVHEKNEQVEVRLKPWATLSGTLMQSNGLPAVGVPLGLTFYNGTDYDGSQPLLHYNDGECTTDSKGHFFFTNVPPRRVQVERIVRSGRGGGWSSVLQTWTEVEPGVTNDLGKITYDQPPAKPVLEQLKEKMGLQ